MHTETHTGNETIFLQADGNIYEVALENLEQFLQDHPNAQKWEHPAETGYIDEPSAHAEPFGYSPSESELEEKGTFERSDPYELYPELVKPAPKIPDPTDDEFILGKPPQAPERKGVRDNKDGTHSTHLMRTEQLEDGSWVSFPSLFQNDDGEWIDMSDEDDWKKVYAEALRRDEVIEFGENKEQALAFGEGSWKEDLADEFSNRVTDYKRFNKDEYKHARQLTYQSKLDLIDQYREAYRDSPIKFNETFFGSIKVTGENGEKRWFGGGGLMGGDTDYFDKNNLDKSLTKEINAFIKESSDPRIRANHVAEQEAAEKKLASTIQTLGRRGIDPWMSSINEIEKYVKENNPDFFEPRLDYEKNAMVMPNETEIIDEYVRLTGTEDLVKKYPVSLTQTLSNELTAGTKEEQLQKAKAKWGDDANVYIKDGKIRIEYEEYPGVLSRHSIKAGYDKNHPMASTGKPMYNLFIDPDDEAAYRDYFVKTEGINKNNDALARANGDEHQVEAQIQEDGKNFLSKKEQKLHELGKQIEFIPLRKGMRKDDLAARNKLVKEYNILRKEVLGDADFIYDPKTRGFVAYEKASDEAKEKENKIKGDAEKLAQSTARDVLKDIRRQEYFELIALADSAKDRIYGRDNIFHNTGIVEFTVQNVGSLFDYARGREGTSILADQKSLNEVARTNRLPKGLDYLPGNHPLAEAFNAKLDRFRTINRAIAINVDPLTEDMPNYFGEFTTNLWKAFMGEGFQKLGDDEGKKLATDDYVTAFHDIMLENGFEPSSDWKREEVKERLHRNMWRVGSDIVTDMSTLLASLFIAKKIPAVKQMQSAFNSIGNAISATTLAKRVPAFKKLVDITIGGGYAGIQTGPGAAMTTTVLGEYTMLTLADKIGVPLFRSHEVDATFKLALGGAGAVSQKLIRRAMASQLKVGGHSLGSLIVRANQHEFLSVTGEALFTGGVGAATMLTAEFASIHGQALLDEGKLAEYEEWKHITTKEHMVGNFMAMTFLGMGKNSGYYGGLIKDISNFRLPRGKARRSADRLGTKTDKDGYYDLDKIKKEIDKKKEEIDANEKLSKQEQLNQKEKLDTDYRVLENFNTLKQAKKQAKLEGKNWAEQEAAAQRIAWKIQENLIRRDNAKKDGTSDTYIEQNFNVQDILDFAGERDISPRHVLAKMGYKNLSKEQEWALINEIKYKKDAAKQYIELLEKEGIIANTKQGKKMLGKLIELDNIRSESNSLKPQEGEAPGVAEVNKIKLKKLKERADKITEEWEKLNLDYQKMVDVEVVKDIEYARKEGQRIFGEGFKMTVHKSQDAFSKKTGAGKNVDGFYDYKTNEIHINLERAKEVRQIGVGSHELFHAILKNSFRDIKTKALTKEGMAFIKVFKESLPNYMQEILDKRVNENYRFQTFDNKRALNEAIKRREFEKSDIVDQFTIKEGEGKGKILIELKKEKYMEEYLTAFSDAIRKKEITYNQKHFDNIKKVVVDILKKQGFEKIGNTSTESIFKLIESYAKSVSRLKIGKKASKVISDQLAIEQASKEKGSAKKEIIEKEIVEKEKDVVEAKEKYEDSQIAKSREVIEYLNERNEKSKAEVTTMLDGSREVRVLVGKGKGPISKYEKGNTLTNEQIIDKDYGEVVGEKTVIPIEKILNPKMLERLSNRQREGLGMEPRQVSESRTKDAFTDKTIIEELGLGKNTEKIVKENERIFKEIIKEDIRDENGNVKPSLKLRNQLIVNNMPRAAALAKQAADVGKNLTLDSALKIDKFSDFYSGYLEKLTKLAETYRAEIVVEDGKKLDIPKRIQFGAYMNTILPKKYGDILKKLKGEIETERLSDESVKKQVSKIAGVTAESLVKRIDRINEANKTYDVVLSKLKKELNLEPKDIDDVKKITGEIITELFKDGITPYSVAKGKPRLYNQKLNELALEKVRKLVLNKLNKKPGGYDKWIESEAGFNFVKNIDVEIMSTSLKGGGQGFRNYIEPVFKPGTKIQDRMSAEEANRKGYPLSKDGSGPLKWKHAKLDWKNPSTQEMHKNFVKDLKPQNLEGLSKFDKMLEIEFAKSPETKHLRANDKYWKPGFEKTADKYFDGLIGDFDVTNIKGRFADLYERRKKVEELSFWDASALRAKLKRAKGENKENIEIALQEKFKKLPDAVAVAGLDIYTGKTKRPRKDAPKKVIVDAASKMIIKDALTSVQKNPVLRVFKKDPKTGKVEVDPITKKPIETIVELLPELTNAQKESLAAETVIQATAEKIGRDPRMSFSKRKELVGWQNMMSKLPSLNSKILELEKLKTNDPILFFMLNEMAIKDGYKGIIEMIDRVSKDTIVDYMAPEPYKTTQEKAIELKEHANAKEAFERKINEWLKESGFDKELFISTDKMTGPDAWSADAVQRAKHFEKAGEVLQSIADKYGVEVAESNYILTQIGFNTLQTGVGTRTKVYIKNGVPMLRYEFNKKLLLNKDGKTNKEALEREGVTLKDKNKKTPEWHKDVHVGLSEGILQEKLVEFLNNNTNLNRVQLMEKLYNKLKGDWLLPNHLKRAVKKEEITVNEAYDRVYEANKNARDMWYEALFDVINKSIKQNVIVNMPDGTVKEISPAEFAKQSGSLAKQGAKFDFSRQKDLTQTLDFISKHLQLQTNISAGISRGSFTISSATLEKGTVFTETQSGKKVFTRAEHALQMLNMNGNFIDVALRNIGNKTEFLKEWNSLSEQGQQHIITESTRKMNEGLQADGTVLSNTGFAEGFNRSDMLAMLNFMQPGVAESMLYLRGDKPMTIAEFIHDKVVKSKVDKLLADYGSKIAAEMLTVSNRHINKEAYDKAKEKNNEILENSGLYSKSQTKNLGINDILGKIKNIDKAIEIAKDPKAKRKGISVLDFDDTVAKTKSKVIVNLPQNLEGVKVIERELAEFFNLDYMMGEKINYKKYRDLLKRKKKVEDLSMLGLTELRARLKKAGDWSENRENIRLAIQEVHKPIPPDIIMDSGKNIYTGKPEGLPSMKLTPAQFAKSHAALQKNYPGVRFDFSEFTKVIGGKKGPLFNKLEKAVNKFGNENVFILTARPQASSTAIQAFLEGMGVKLKIENIKGLEDGRPEAKAQWMVDKAAEGYNDFFFADDAIANTKAVKKVLDVIDVKSDVRQAMSFSRSKLNKDFHEMIEYSTGIGKEKTYSPATAKMAGLGKRRKNIYIESRAEDFHMLMMPLYGKGKKGMINEEWVMKNLVEPFARGDMAYNTEVRTRLNEYVNLRDQLVEPGSIASKVFEKHPLNKPMAEGEHYTNQHAIRVFNWARQGTLPKNLSKTDIKKLTRHVENNPKLRSFADQVLNLYKGELYPKPTETWLSDGITQDILLNSRAEGRARHLKDFNNNVSLIFDAEGLTMNKLEAAFGTPYRIALENSLHRMKTGSNRNSWGSKNKWEADFLDWMHGSIGSTMFLNTRSAFLQQVSALNYINYADNNPIAAAKAFANGKQFYKDYKYLMNSEWALNRRDGLRFSIAESEILDLSRTAKNKGAVAINYALSKGFIMTKYMDSHATAFGGASFYRNRINTYIKEGFTKQRAEQKAYKEWVEISEKTQQTARYDMVSMEQASVSGKLILNYNNVNLNYAKQGTKKQVSDLSNGRYDHFWKGNNSALAKVGRIIYYNAMQSLLFHGLQKAYFKILFDDSYVMDSTEQEIVNATFDSFLVGMGIKGKILATFKNWMFKAIKESKKRRPDYSDTLTELLKISPALEKKYKMGSQALDKLTYDMDEIKRKGFSLDSPIWDIFAKTIEGATNAPLDNFQKNIKNISDALEAERVHWQRPWLLLGWEDWQFSKKQPKPSRRKTIGIDLDLDLGLDLDLDLD
jgi:hypothetical protein